MQDSKLVKNRSIMDAATVARAGIDAALRGDALVIPGVANKLQALVPRLVPRFLVPRLVRSAQARSGS
jgi:short-subunit dehydrogenase